MTNMKLEKIKVMRWIKKMKLDDWYTFSTVLDCMDGISNQIFSCKRCKEEYGECDNINHNGSLCKVRFKQHSLRKVI